MSHDKDETPRNEVFGKIGHSFCSITHCEILTLRNNLQSTKPHNSFTTWRNLPGIFSKSIETLWHEPIIWDYEKDL